MTEKTPLLKERTYFLEAPVTDDLISASTDVKITKVLFAGSNGLYVPGDEVVYKAGNFAEPITLLGKKYIYVHSENLIICKLQ